MRGLRSGCFHAFKTFKNCPAVHEPQAELLMAESHSMVVVPWFILVGTRASELFGLLVKLSKQL